MARYTYIVEFRELSALCKLFLFLALYRNDEDNIVLHDLRNIQGEASKTGH